MRPTEFWCVCNTAGSSAFFPIFLDEIVCTPSNDGAFVFRGIEYFYATTSFFVLFGLWKPSFASLGLYTICRTFSTLYLFAHLL